MKLFVLFDSFDLTLSDEKGIVWILNQFCCSLEMQSPEEQPELIRRVYGGFIEFEI